MAKLVGIGVMDETMFPPFWQLGLRDMFKSRDAIAEDCLARVGEGGPDDVMTCAVGRVAVQQSSRAAIGVGLAIGALGAWLVMRRKKR